MMLERVTFLHDIVDTPWLHAAPTAFNAKLVKKKWKDQTSGYLEELAAELEALDDFSSAAVETRFKAFLEAKELGFGQVLLPFRIALTGEGGGPSMFDFAAFLGQEATLQRLHDGVAAVEEMRDHD